MTDTHRKRNCSVTKENRKICETTSRRLGRIITASSSIYEKLINVADSYLVGSILIGTPTQVFSVVFTSIDDSYIVLGGTYDSYVTMYTVDCMKRPLSSFPNVTFVIDGQAFTLTPLQYISILNNDDGTYVCYTIFLQSNIYDSNGNFFWILGNYFLERFYSVIDIINNQVRFTTSISYNWTQSIDSVLFPNTEFTTVAIVSTLKSTMITTPVTFLASKMTITMTNTTENIVWILTLLLIKTF
ncbi:hypothetical protein I4U23_017843 [Adineta vaga]|nr:hypothetical protein I4U23_017843 [Adineta vaga]